MAEFRSDHRSYGGGDRNFQNVNDGYSKNRSGLMCEAATSGPERNGCSRGSTNQCNYNKNNKNRNNNNKVEYSSSWSFNDPEIKRRKRIVKYKAYAVEGKVKSSFGRGFRWIRNKCSELVHGY